MTARGGERADPPGDRTRDPGAGRREWQILALVLLGSFMAVLDKSFPGVNAEVPKRTALSPIKLTVAPVRPGSAR